MRSARALAICSAASLLAFGCSDDDSPTSVDPGPTGPSPLELADYAAASVVIGQIDAASSNPNGRGGVGETGLSTPYGVCGGASLYVADFANNRVLGYASIPTSNGAAADWVVGQESFSASGAGLSDEALNGPVDCLIADGKLFVADFGNNRVLIWNTPPTSNATADVVLGQPDFTTNDPGTDSRSMSGPAALFVWGGRLFVTDQVNNRVLVWNEIPTVSGTGADVVIGQPNFSSSLAGVSATAMFAPWGLWVDEFGLLICDSINGRVLVYDSIPTANGAPADRVIGKNDLATNGGEASATNLINPRAVVSDGFKYFVADAGAHRIMIYERPTANGPAPVGILGQTTFTGSAGNDPNQDGVPNDGVSARTFSVPTWVAIVGSRLLVTDQGNHRVLVFEGE